MSEIIKTIEFNSIDNIKKYLQNTMKHLHMIFKIKVRIFQND